MCSSLLLCLSKYLCLKQLTHVAKHCYNLYVCNMFTYNGQLNTNIMIVDLLKQSLIRLKSTVFHARIGKIPLF